MKTLNHVRIELRSSMFSSQKQLLAKSKNVSVHTFCYSSGVEGLEINISDVEVIWLPFLGSEIWDWELNGESQKFEGFVTEPSYGKSFLHNYGAFLIHCGLLSMGNPTKRDNHPQHGELPISRASSAWVELNTIDDNYPIAICSEFNLHIPFEASYTFIPKIKIHKSGKHMIVVGKVLNESKTTLDYQYLSHINFRYPERGQLSYSIDKISKETVEILDDVIPGVVVNPQKMLSLDKNMVYDPELVAIINHSKKAPSTYSDGKYVLNSCIKEGEKSMWVVADTTHLDHTVAWLTKTEDRAACGFSLPSTSGPTGLANESEKGNLKHLAPGQTIHLCYAFGIGDKNYSNEVDLAIRTMKEEVEYHTI